MLIDLQPELGRSREPNFLELTILHLNPKTQNSRFAHLENHYGGGDRVTPLANSLTFVERATIADQEMCEYPDSYNELHNDLNYLEVLTDMNNWIEIHL